MSKKYNLAVLALVLVVGVVSLGRYLASADIPVLSPGGLIGQQEQHLIYIAALLSLVVVLPVFALTIYIVWHYRESKDNDYRPDWDHNTVLETIWWGIPLVLISILSVITWNSSHQLDPFRDLDSNVKPMTIQVIALDWKWLFIYPDQHMATVNYVQFPVGTPIDFEITADAPMNSFWIPGLGGQIYAMSGMSTHLHLISGDLGTYRGSSANISGDGFAGMHFKARAVTPLVFDQWTRFAQRSPNKLNTLTYAQLAKPSKNNSPQTYSLTTEDLYNDVVMKYMLPGVGSANGVIHD